MFSDANCSAASRGPKVLVVAALLIANCINARSMALGPPPTLRAHGRTLIEAETFSAAATGVVVEDAPRCSGKKSLGYFWGGKWFELTLSVPRMLNYSLTLRASALKQATQIEVLTIDVSGESRLLTTIDVPKTRSWDDFLDTAPVTISLPAGVQTLRFKNLVDGANIDYVTISTGDSDDVVLTRPAPGDGPEINPLKGFISGWSRNDEDFASVGFQCINWRALEPQDDVFNWDNVEKIIDRSGSKERHLILQLVVDWDESIKSAPVEDSHYKGPDWLLAKVGENRGPAFPGKADSRITRATRYNNPVFIEEATEAIKALLDHYQDDPRTFVLQVGVLGYSGSWHTYPRTDWSPTKQTKFAILDAYTGNLRPGALTQVRYPDEPVVEPQLGLGYTNGSATLTKYGREFGLSVAKGKLWKNGPISGKWPPGVELKHWQKFFLSDDGQGFINQGHYSTLFAPTATEMTKKLPGWNKDGLFMKMHRQMGYNFQVKAVRHLASADKSNQIHIEVDLQNIGIAPFYKDWDVQLAILNSKTAAVMQQLDVETDIRNLGPNEHITLSCSGVATLDLQADYQIGLRILQPGADQARANAWKLKARNTYVVLANEVPVIQGVWKKKNALRGGWNILSDIQRQEFSKNHVFEGPFFPFEGSFRPSGG